MKISIITVTYNRADVLSDAMQSVLEQTYVDLEYILVDGGSTDGTLNLIHEYKDKFGERLQYVSEPDRGIYDAMNKGWQMATGEIVAFLNSDDYYVDNHVIHDVAKTFEAQEIDAIHGNLSYIDSDKKIVRIWRGSAYSPEAFLKGWMPAHPTFFCRRSCFEQFGGFDLAICSAADFELMLRFVEKHGIVTYYFNRHMVNMRMGGASTLGLKSIWRNNRENMAAFRKNGIKVPFFYSCLRLFSKIKSLKNPISYLFNNFFKFP